MTREECLRFVLGDARKPLIYNVQHTEEERGYAGFNPKYPARSKFKRLTCIWEHASDMGQNKPHECHKPEPLARTQILTSTNPGDTVLDLFAGSGEVSLTARKLGRRFVAYENDPAQFDALVRRLSE
jgi:DNA modification methylase